MCWHGRQPLPQFDAVRLEMGHALRVAKSLDLAAMVPANELSSSHYCLANRGAEYCAFAPEGGPITLNLTDARGTFACEWYDPARSAFAASGTCKAGAKRTIEPPFAEARVVHLTHTD